MTQTDFWEDHDQAEKVSRQLKDIKALLASFAQLKSLGDNAEVLLELLEIDPDPALEAELAKSLDQLQVQVDKMEVETLFSSDYDQLDAYVMLHAGAGGTESQDWVEMLYRMYLRWAERAGFTSKILDYQAGDEAGIKSVTFSLEGRHAFGYLRSEKGVHRLVRISPFDTASRRHTSFASLDVVPQMPEEEAISIDEGDLRIDTYRAGGAGGQHINKTDSAVRLTHLPTGIVVQCQSERSQFSNKASAMKILQAKLYDKKRLDEEEKLAQVRGAKHDIAWGSQIRSYVFHPYKMVKDHRSKLEVGNVDRVMDGDLTPFMQAYLHLYAGQDLEEER